MGKRKKGRPRGRGGMGGPGGRWRRTLRKRSSARSWRTTPLQGSQRSASLSRNRSGSRQRRTGRRRAGPGRPRTAPQRLRLSAQSQNNFLRERTDPFVPGTMIDKFRLREGVLDQRHGAAGPQAAGPAAEGNHRRRRHEARGLRQRQELRRADADQSRKLAAAGNRPDAAHHARDGPAHAAGQGPAGPDRRPAAHRQDDPAAAHRQRDRHELSRASR